MAGSIRVKDRNRALSPRGAGQIFGQAARGSVSLRTAWSLMRSFQNSSRRWLASMQRNATMFCAPSRPQNIPESGLLISSPYFWQTWKTPDTMRRIRSLNINTLREVIEENAIKMGSAIFHGIRSSETLSHKRTTVCSPFQVMVPAHDNAVSTVDKSVLFRCCSKPPPP